MVRAQGLKPGTQLLNGKYRIEKVLGTGTFGITYLATARFTTQGNLGKMEVEAQVAIKEFFMDEVNGRTEDGSSVEGSTGSVFINYRTKFRKEAKNLSKLDNPNIVKVFDVFDENNTTYYVMEFLKGQNLDEYIKEKGRLGENESVKIINEIGEALSYMHSMNMLHLDIKPKNVMRNKDGKFYLIDFGLSKQFTEEGEPESSTSIGMGTPGYSPIEQSGYKQDGTFPATLDVYALSATLFKMLTGERPPEATFILNDGFPTDSIQKLGLSETTKDTLIKGMSPIKKQRYQDVRSFLNDLNKDEAYEATIIDVPEKRVESKPKSKSSAISKMILALNRRKWIWYAVGAGAALAIFAIFILTKPSGNNIHSLIDSTLVEQIPIEPQRVTNMTWNSPLGKALYSGTVEPDSVHGSNKLIPHGKGVAKITDGIYAGSIYDGEFNMGKFEGRTRYIQTNGDTFEGTFRNNKYSNGKYTIKSSGEFFKGSFKNGQPNNGQWYDKDGNAI